MVRSVCLQLSPPSRSRLSYSHIIPTLPTLSECQRRRSRLHSQFSFKCEVDKQIWSKSKTHKQLFQEGNTFPRASLVQTSEISIDVIPEVEADVGKENLVWKEWKCERRPCAVSHMNEQQHMTYPQLLWMLFFWVARRYFQLQQTAPWLIHDRGRGWIKYSFLTHKHTPNAYSWISYLRLSCIFCFFNKSGCEHIKLRQRTRQKQKTFLSADGKRRPNRYYL